MSRPKPSRISLLVWAATVVPLVACGSDRNMLSGSIGPEYTTSFDAVQIEWVTEELVIRYLLGSGRGRVEPVRLTVPKSVALAEGEQPLDLVHVEHFVARARTDGTYEQEPDFPKVDGGWIRFDRMGTDLDAVVAGQFSVIFLGGRTLGGKFESQVVDPG